jgi:hypothetical protein
MQQTAQDAEDGSPGSVSSQAPVVEGHSPDLSAAHQGSPDSNRLPTAFHQAQQAHQAQSK